MKKLSKYLLALIILIAIFARFYKLSSIPVGFNDDEAAFGYNAYSILKTGIHIILKTLPYGNQRFPKELKKTTFFQYHDSCMLMVCSQR